MMFERLFLFYIQYICFMCMYVFTRNYIHTPVDTIYIPTYTQLIHVTFTPMYLECSL